MKTFFFNRMDKDTFDIFRLSTWFALSTQGGPLSEPGISLNIPCLSVFVVFDRIFEFGGTVNFIKKTKTEYPEMVLFLRICFVQLTLNLSLGPNNLEFLRERETHRFVKTGNSDFSSYYLKKYKNGKAHVVMYGMAEQLDLSEISWADDGSRVTISSIQNRGIKCDTLLM